MSADARQAARRWGRGLGRNLHHHQTELSRLTAIKRLPMYCRFCEFGKTFIVNRI